ncbi:MAG: hypothetical protein DMG03_24055 [Acidobacteria bacterium]|nr:MAG: hypothetical protein DMG03_24055 [Acidobacteriota bacterium]
MVAAWRAHGRPQLLPRRRSRSAATGRDGVAADGAAADGARADARHLGREGHGAAHRQLERSRPIRDEADGSPHPGRDALGRAREIGRGEPRDPRVPVAVSAPRFKPQALKFLRALKRNNRRDWFNAHKDDYETHVREPMIAIIEQLARDFREFAPELVATPKASLYRIYRDTRLPKHEGAGVYFHISPDGVWVGGGMYSPQTAQLVAVREHIAGNVRCLRAIVESPAFRRHVGALEGERLQRVPRGYPKDHAAAEYLKFRQFLAGRELPASFAISPRFYDTLLTIFRQVVPLTRFLNAPLLGDR